MLSKTYKIVRRMMIYFKSIPSREEKIASFLKVATNNSFEKCYRNNVALTWLNRKHFSLWPNSLWFDSKAFNWSPNCWCFSSPRPISIRQGKKLKSKTAALKDPRSTQILSTVVIGWKTTSNFWTKRKEPEIWWIMYVCVCLHICMYSYKVGNNTCSFNR